MTEFVRFNAGFEFKNEKTKARTRYPAGWAGEAEPAVIAAARNAGVLQDDHPASAEPSVGLDKLTKDELVALAKERGVSHEAAATKAQIVEAIRAAEAG